MVWVICIFLYFYLVFTSFTKIPLWDRSDTVWDIKYFQDFWSPVYSLFSLYYCLYDIGRFSVSSFQERYWEPLHTTVLNRARLKKKCFAQHVCGLFKNESKPKQIQVPKLYCLLFFFIMMTRGGMCKKHKFDLDKHQR